MAITKKKNKFSVPKEYNRSVIFASGGQIFDSNGNIFAGGADLNLLQNIKAGNTQSAIGQGLGVAQGGMQLGSQIFGNFDTSGIGKEVQSTNDISRGDIMNSNVNVDSMKSNVAGQSLTGAMTGAKAGMSIAGPLGAGIGAGVGLIGGGLSSIFGNSAKQRKADQEAQQWTNNLEAKDRQFNQQDLRSNMANFNANGGDLFAYGGQMPNQLTEFNSGGTHESNPNQGIMQGAGANGQPNLVEEGETKHEDYIFSDRLKIDPKVSKEFKLPAGLNGKTFAAASKYLSREGKDRPNDPISNKAIKAHLAKLTAAQEGLKEQMQPQGIPTEQPNANVLAQGFAKGGDLKSTPISNNNFWGYENNQYTPEYTKDVDNILLKDWDTAKKYMTDNNVNYAQTPEGFRAAAFDGKVGDVHKYIYGRHKDTPIDNTSYTHTTDRNFYDSGQLSPEEKALYNPETLTRNITKEEFEKAMKTNNEEVSTTGPGYRRSKNAFAFGGDQTHYNNPTHQGANIYSGKKPHSSQLTRDNRFDGMEQLGIPMNGINQQKYANDQVIYGNKFNIHPQIKDIHTAIKEDEGFRSRNPEVQQQGLDYSRYAPVAANMITGISDMFQKPEEVKYGRVSPEMNTSRMDYQPIDTEWMNNKMNATYAGTRDQMINNAGGNRAAAMAGLSGINQQQQNAVGEAYLKAQDINYGRKQQANQFNAGIEQQNVAAQNQAQQLNIQIAMQEAEMNARNRAAKRNAARQAILNAASNIGDIGRENYAFKTGAQMTDYEVGPDGKIRYIGNNNKSRQ